MSSPYRKNLQRADSFVELEVYKKARSLAQVIFKLTLNLPPEERFALIDQVRRSSGSVGAQIAEAWAKRRYPKHFTSKLTDADGEQLETQHWMNVIEDRNYLTPEQLAEPRDLCQQIGRMLGSMLRNPGSFSSSINESNAEYDTEI